MHRVNITPCESVKSYLARRRPMSKSTGLGQRLVERIKALGYEDQNSKYGIKVSEFAFDFRYREGSLFKWLGDVVIPDHEMMLRLAKDLKTTPGWLHYGEGEPSPTPPPSRRRRPVPIAGGSAAPPGLSTGEELDTECGLSDTASRLYRWLAWPVLPRLSPA
jgi:hypothetical protein